MVELDTLQASVIASMLVALAGVGFLELRYMRNRRRKREEQGELPDRAHNALASAQGIAESLGRTGVRSAEANDLLREAEAAISNRNYRVARELADKAKAILRTEKARYEVQGDLAKLQSTKPPVETESTVKEKLAKELPPNYTQAKFSINLARDAIEAARTRGQDIGAAERMLAEAQATFDASDYTGALAQASRARRSLEVGPTKPPTIPGTTAVAASRPPATVPTARVRPCPSCGANVALDDPFCRRCGAKVPSVRLCASCRSEIAADDTFCRKCGAKVAAEVAKP